MQTVVRFLNYWLGEQTQEIKPVRPAFCDTVYIYDVSKNGEPQYYGSLDIKRTLRDECLGIKGDWVFHT